MRFTTIVKSETLCAGFQILAQANPVLSHVELGVAPPTRSAVWADTTRVPHIGSCNVRHTGTRVRRVGGSRNLLPFETTHLATHNTTTVYESVNANQSTNLGPGGSICLMRNSPQTQSGANF